MSQYRRFAFVAPLLLALALAGCEKNPLKVTRSLCPAVAIPNNVGSTTVFAPTSSRDASALDLTASIVNLRGACIDTSDQLGTAVSFDVVALRRVAGPARSVTLPFFVAMVQGGNLVVSKQVSQVTLNFADGQVRTQTASGAQAQVARSAATLPPEIQALITRKRKPGDLDAASDPMADPQIKASVRAHSFEVLVGFQLDDEALVYNIAK